MRPFLSSVPHRVILLALGLALAQPAQAETPLLLEGKTTLFQRVLIRAAAPRHAAPDQPAQGGP